MEVVETEGKHGIVVFFNKEKFVAPKETMTGGELRELFRVPSENKLFREEHGHGPDTLITPDMAVHLKNGDKFYDLPPGKVG